MPNKRILILMHYMMLGGAESALLGLLQAHAERRRCDASLPDVDVFVYDHRGELMPYLHEVANVLPAIPEYTMLERPITELLRQGYFRLALMRMMGKIEARLTHGSELVCQQRWAVRALPMILGAYDVAISFLTPHYIVEQRVNALRRVGWIHTDYTKIPVDVNRELPMWNALDTIVSISDEVTTCFLKVFPAMQQKIVKIENILSAAFMRKRAAEQMIDWLMEARQAGVAIECLEKESIFLSIGRFCDAKNYDNVPDICRRLVEAGYSVRWYLIGYGGDEMLIRDRIREAGMQEHVILLGKRDNPYPYLQACDVYVQPSRYEGKSITVREAQILCKPVVVTAYATASAQIKDGVDGSVVPMDNAGCAEGIARVLEDKTLRERLVNHLQTHDYGMNEEIRKVYELCK